MTRLSNKHWEPSLLAGAYRRAVLMLLEKYTPEPNA
eukprot:CAMPEP_0202707938 /NCGR_PEP_ID=MMETSP1385-20130828/20215_1 /ASSEMBLY_ACC=CAM_ASM_000861 /TAXON_ID=933848 /ORGANISM="Elphidium margaritaceum" /LENGTH=35 /DNA_ID= /DNA_START= /DNA_END= /DNA_ORIENTATION=